ncbi:MAG: hypothetical protein J5725_13300 [Bacteroidales bacterium]|nr:hypothetical protein [Bacteroidales bacterium]
MTKFRVTMYYHTSCEVEVEADSQEEAIELAYDVDCDRQLLNNLQEDDDPDVKEIEDNGLYNVVVGGMEINNVPLPKYKADELAQQFIDDNYKDVEIVEVPTDINGKVINVGNKVIWHDPAEESEDQEYEVYEIRDDVICLSSEFGECEALAKECEIKD